MASAKVLEQKQLQIDKIKAEIEQSKTMVLFKYQGLPVSALSELRCDLRKDGGSVKVYKNTMLKRALEKLGYDLDDYMNGPNAIVFGTDQISAIKSLATFAKQNNSVEIRTGIIDGDIVGLDIINEYATIPSREALLTMFAGGLMEHVRNFAIGVDLIAKQKEQESN